MLYPRNVTILLIPTHPWPCVCAWKEVEELNHDIASPQITSILNNKPKESKITKRCCFCLILIQ